MKKLNRNEWIAVTIAVCVVGFFFIFGQTLLSFFNDSTMDSNASQSSSYTEDVVSGMGDTAVSGSRVTIHYTGRFTDGKVFDTSITRGEPMQFVLGQGQVIPGFDQGIMGMKVGGKRIITIPPELGYGMQDYGPIPGGSTLIFEIELLKVE